MNPTKSAPHTSVLLSESLDALNIKTSGVYLDGTFGRGGHSSELLKLLSADARLVAVDRDATAIDYGKTLLEGDDRVEFVHSDFARLQEEVELQGMPKKYDGILFDLGVSSPQLDEADRGFSFMRDGPLDMRMDSSKGFTAADFLKHAEVDEIANVIYQLGEEKFSRRIARMIVERREEEGPLETTMELVDLLEEAIVRKEKHKHKATRTFMALRMHVNDELGQIEAMLPQAVKMLKPGGRLAVISFHSREDRIVKQFFRGLSKGPVVPRNLPIQPDYSAPIKLIGKAIKPSQEEISQNVRSRSAILRIIERTEVMYA